MTLQRTPDTGAGRGTIALLVMLATCCGQAPEGQSTGAWRDLEPGLAFAEFLSPQSSESGESKIRVLRIDPRHFDLRLINASRSEDERPRTARDWSRMQGLVAAINTSMYQKDYRRSVSLMQTRTHINNPRLSKDMSILAFDRLDESVPPVQIIDRECQDFDELRRHYGTLVQSIRMISCDGRNVWSKQSGKWSTAAIGMDSRGRVLFIHVRAVYSTHDLIDVLIGLPIDIVSAMYTEGGPEAQMYFSSGGKEAQFVGSHDIGPGNRDDPARAWPVPNVVGVVRKAPADE